MFELTWIQLFILALASFRLTHLIVYDDITWALRSPFLAVSYVTHENGTVIREIEIKGTGIRRWMGMLLSCHWCTGIWCAMLVTALYCYVPASFPLLLMLAVAGIAALIEQYLLQRLG
ncbi:DUF1360 domain-containing protein [Paenibacillus sp. MER TA 81-3]|uniref:DUF1360 domain-containing protein n=1 Tax=Paenibacillus sp. MER TA 81-3 TaxID=2939573 RepID=UPI00203A484C|nr:DUF1360 domain-containing protein [Paenibacillus sp. MER TA 81-3]MCM3339825.1 DUF1360 domain-containing protein [Paenibacillus sp. MER TA 81-3]